jgi:tetratricopeptide (TPR) repeat protein
MLASHSARLRFGLVVLLLSGRMLDAPYPALAAQETPNLKRRENIHRYLYAIYTKQGNNEEQVNELNELIKLQPHSALFQFLLGMTEFKQTNFHQAIVHFDEALKIQRNFEMAWDLKAECYARLGETAKASAAHQKGSDAKNGMQFVGDFGSSDFRSYDHE